MNRRTKSLFFAILSLAVLTQVVVLGWGAEAVFFVTWLFLALTVRHDSRLSAGVGLAFLGTCPFLLLAKKDSVAELTANYAYFFLAIGVLTQLEEMALERYGWGERKLDFSHAWRPAAQVLSGHWTAAAQQVGRQLATAERAQLVRWVQVGGAAGLALVFLWAALSGLRPAVVLPLLGGALLFPFVVWAGRLVVRALGGAAVLRVGLALVVLPLAAAEMVWLYDLVGAERLARMEVAYDFLDHLDEAQMADPAPEGESVAARFWAIEDTPRRVLYQHPALVGHSRIAYRVYAERRAMLAFDVATAPESWALAGDGVTFAVYVQGDQSTQQVFSTYVDPKHDEADRRWHSYTIDLSDYAGQAVRIIFETGIGPAGDYQYDWAGWGEPRLLRP